MTRIMDRWWWTRQTWTSEIPGLPHSVVKHAQSTSVRQLIQKIENHPNRHALQQNLRQNQSFNPFSPESKQMIRDVENIELCELLETEPKAQCKVCLSYWDIGIVYCTCGHFLRKRRGANQQFIKFTMDLLSILEYVIKKGRPHGHRNGKKRETGNTFRPTSWRRNARKSFSKESMIDSYDMKHSVIEWLKMVETKMFVVSGMLLQMKIIPTIWPHKNIIITRVIGGFIQTRQVPIHLISKQALSTLQQLKEKDAGAQRNQQWAQSSSSSWWSWQGSWWTPYSYESHHGDEPSTDRTGWPVVQVLGTIFRAWFSWIQLLCYRWIVYSWRRSTGNRGSV